MNDIISLFFQRLEEFIFNKQELNQNGPLEPGHFKRVGNVSEHAEDARSVFLVKHIFTEIILVQKVIHKDKNPEVLKSIQTEIVRFHPTPQPLPTTSTFPAA